jgi:hypothetical protein
LVSVDAGSELKLDERHIASLDVMVGGNKHYRFPVLVAGNARPVPQIIRTAPPAPRELAPGTDW